MEEFQKRLVEEYDSLGGKIGKLKEFIFNNPIFTKLAKEKQVLMTKQLGFMESYFSTLKERIELEDN